MRRFIQGVQRQKMADKGRSLAPQKNLRKQGSIGARRGSYFLCSRRLRLHVCRTLAE